LRILHVRLRRGREFDRRDRSGAPRVAIVNDALVREYFPATDPVGQRIRIAADPAGDWATIVGVAASVKTTTVFREMGWAEAPAVYFPLAQVTPPTAALLVRGAGVGRRQIEDALRTLDPDAVVGYFESVDTSMAKLLAYPRFRAVVLGGFALFALALAGTGLYAVLSQLVARRDREIVIRIALGAQPGDIVRMVTQEAAIPLASGLAAGVAAVLAAGRLAAALLYGAGPRNPGLLVTICVVLVAAATAATIGPARRAARRSWSA
jgi:putative ABC transport system permease protein